MPDRLHFTDSIAACELIAADPLALLVGFVLDQQITVQKAFAGPYTIGQRIGSFDLDALLDADLDAVFRQRPAVHRYPAAMATRVHSLALHIRDNYDGDAARIWTEASDASELRQNLKALPGFGDMKVISIASVLSKRFGIAVADALVPPHPTLGDVDSPAALADYQESKRAYKQAQKAKR